MEGDESTRVSLQQYQHDSGRSSVNRPAFIFLRLVFPPLPFYHDNQCAYYTSSPQTFKIPKATVKMVTVNPTAPAQNLLSNRRVSLRFR